MGYGSLWGCKESDVTEHTHSEKPLALTIWAAVCSYMSLSMGCGRGIQSSPENVSPKTAFLSKQSCCSRCLGFGNRSLGTSFLPVGATLGNISVTVDVVISEYVCAIEIGTWYLKFVCMFGYFSCVQLFVTPRTIARSAPLSMGSSRQEYWSGSHALLQGIFMTQGSDPGLLRLLHCRHTLTLLSHRGSPFQV